MLLKKIKYITLFIFLLLYPGISYSDELIDTAEITDSTVVASVGAVNIYFIDYIERYEDYLIASGAKENLLVREQILRNMINEKLLFYYDDNQSILQDPAYAAELERIKKETILAYLKDQEIYAKITSTDEEAREAFLRANQKLAAQHLYASNEEEANELYDLLMIGVDFNKLAYQVFTDTALKNSGGYLGYFSWGDMDPYFEEAAYKLKVGEISKPVKTKYGYSIIRLVDRATRPLLTENEFLNKKSKLKNLIRINKKAASEDNYIKSVFDEDELKFNDGAIEQLLSYDIIRERSSAPQSDKVCAIYKGREYTSAEIKERLLPLSKKYRHRIGNLESLKTVIKAFIMQDVLLKIAIDKKYDQDPVVLDYIDKASLNYFLQLKRKNILAQKNFPDSVLLKSYERNKEQFKEDNLLTVQEIIVSDEELADSIRSMILKGDDFGALAERYTLRESAAKNKGIIENAPVGKFGFLKDKFWNAPFGEVIGPEKISNYYGIFKVLERKEGKVKPYSEVKRLVEDVVRSENSFSILKEYMEKSWNAQQIVINDDVITQFKLQD